MEFNKTFNLKKDKGIFIAYDHGIEHGPKDFAHPRSSDPAYIIELCAKHNLNGIILTPGVIEKYSKELKEKNVNTIAKINSKSTLSPNQEYSPLTSSVENVAQHENVKGIGYTIYFGSLHEHEMIETFTTLKEEAKEYGLHTIVWAYLNGKNIKDVYNKDSIAYASRISMELGADAIKIKFPKSTKNLNDIMKYIHRTYVFVAGGEKTSESQFIKFSKEIYNSQAHGLIVGRNVWQSKNANTLLRKIKEFF